MNLPYIVLLLLFWFFVCLFYQINSKNKKEFEESNKNLETSRERFLSLGVLSWGMGCVCWLGVSLQIKRIVFCTIDNRGRELGK